jgi:hypothetical protein
MVLTSEHWNKSLDDYVHVDGMRLTADGDMDLSHAQIRLF